MKRGQELRLSDKLMYSTVKINCKKKDGWYSGTGFVFRTEDNIPVIVSNNHVIDGSLIGQFIMTEGDEYNEPAIGKTIKFEVKNFSKQWIPHPVSQIDLAVMPLRVVANEWSKRGQRPFFTAIGSGTIPIDQEWKQFIPLEDIVMIGYPNGLEDSFNNLPLFRKGITASHPAINYEGKEEFVIDTGIYPGSSGSPVFLLTTEFYEKSREIQRGPDHVRLLGIVQEVFIYTAEGKIVKRNLKKKEVMSIKPTKISSSKSSLQKVHSAIPIDLGKVIRSTKLRDFEPILNERSNEVGL